MCAKNARSAIAICYIDFLARKTAAPILKRLTWPDLDQTGPISSVCFAQTLDVICNICSEHNLKISRFWTRKSGKSYLFRNWSLSLSFRHFNYHNLWHPWHKQNDKRERAANIKCYASLNIIDGAQNSSVSSLVSLLQTWACFLIRSLTQAQTWLAWLT